MPPLKNRPDKAVYALGRTSNPSAPQFQGDLETGIAGRFIKESQQWETDGHLGYVIGATYPHELEQARALAPNASFLIPGIGAQGGNLPASVEFGAHGEVGPVISSSRGIIYASFGLDFAEAARTAALKVRTQINEERNKPAV